MSRNISGTRKVIFSYTAEDDPVNLEAKRCHLLGFRRANHRSSGVGANSEKYTPRSQELHRYTLSAPTLFRNLILHTAAALE